MYRQKQVLLSLLACLASTGVCFAQTTNVPAFLKTATGAGVHVEDANSRLLHAVPAGTKITPSLNLQTNTSTGVSASSQSQIFITGEFVVVTVSDRGSATVQSAKGRALFGTTASTDKSNVKPGPYKLRVDIRLPNGAAGKLRVRYSGKMAGNVRGIATVDIGADGSNEFDEAAKATAVERNFAVRAGTQGLSLVVSTNAQGSILGQGSASYETGLVISYIPQPGCTFTPYGSSCGPKLDGATIPTPGGAVISLLVSKAIKSGGIWLGIGLRKTSVTIPGFQCPLVVDPLVVAAWNADKDGNLKMVLGAGPTSPFAFLAQVYAYDRQTGKVLGSNGISASCR